MKEKEEDRPRSGIEQGLKVHSRLYEIQKANSEILKAISNLTAKFNLSYGELFSILGDIIRRYAEYLRSDKEKD